MALEDSFMAIAKLQKPDQDVVVMCDRGLMDGSAFMTPKNWQTMLNELHITDMSTLCNERYDAIIHMMSAAKDAEEHYARDIPGQPRH